MVKNFARIILFNLALLSLSGCSMTKRFWGEKGLAQKIVTVQSTPLPSFTKVLEGSDAESIAVLDQWKTSTLNSFGKIRGSRSDFLSEAEMGVIIKQKLLVIADDEKISLARAHSMIHLLGFSGGIAKSDLIRLFSWIEENRIRIRTFYSIFISENVISKAMSEASSQNIVQLIELFGSMIALGGSESYSAEMMTEFLQPWIPANLVHLHKATHSSISLAISFFSSLCGDRVEANAWNGKKIGTCLNDLTVHFQPMAPVLDYMVDNLNPLTERNKLAESSKQLVPLVTDWMKDHHHPAFPLNKISDLTDTLEIPKPYNFFKLTEWLPKLNPRNTLTTFHPDFMIDLAQLMQDWASTFTKVTAKQTCSQDVLRNDWKNCKFTGKYDILDQIYNDQYAKKVRKKNLKLVSQTALFHSAANFIMKALDDDKNGELDVQIKDLITVTIRAVDSTAFLQNVISRIQEKPVYTSSLDESLNKFKKAGLSELAALAASIMPKREDDDTPSALDRLVSSFDDHGLVVPYSIDTIGITTLMSVYTLITDLRQDYLTRYDLPQVFETPNDAYVKRAKIVQALPRLLRDHFPRLYQSCKEWGFERTCGVVFTELLASPNPGRDDLYPSEIDLVTTGAIFAESILSRCDRNNDNLISRGYFHPASDEKVCALKISQALLMRLISTGIVDHDPKIEFLAKLVTGRMFGYVGKAALGRGTLENIIAYALPPLSLEPLNASLGSIFSLAAEVMDPDKVDAIKANIMGPHEDAGDEFIYLHQLSQHYMLLESTLENE